MTSFGNNGCTEYEYRKELLNKLNKEIILIKQKTNRIRKKALTKREERKKNIVNELHWKTIKNIVNNNDIIFYGDIKSQNISVKSNNKSLKRAFSDMCFYKFKTRLQYKALVENKRIFEVNEAYTTQTCSYCGNMYKPECSKLYNCEKCKKTIDRDINAAKNILMKGIINNLY